ncbi:MAG: DUF2141 domain-containing protein [Bacteroidales bacterium]|nr:DUF2141 domain-containing protein [Bacteroidales bacterium]
MKITSPSITLNVKPLVLCILLSTQVSIFCQAQSYACGRLIITFTDIRSNAGQIAMGLYDAEEQWTDAPKYNFVWDKGHLKNGNMTVEIDSLPRGKYACAVLDDEDLSLSMNYILSLPAEGWGMSTNPSFLKLKKPGFEEVTFELNGPALRIWIKMNYLNRKKKIK